MKVILASASPARLRTLRDAGIEPQVRVADVDEDAILSRLRDSSFPDQVMALASAKAREIAAAPGQLVIGADSMLEVAGQLVGKPHTPQLATQRIHQMQGKTAVLHTGHCVRLDIGGEIREKTACSHAEIHFAEMSKAEIEAYVATGEPLEVAGSFTIDGLGGAFVESIVGDYHGVVGLSLPLLRQMVTDLGVSWPSLWNRITVPD